MREKTLLANVFLNLDVLFVMFIMVLTTRTTEGQVTKLSLKETVAL